MKLVLYLLFWRNVDGYVNITNIDMFDYYSEEYMK